MTAIVSLILFLLSFFQGAVVYHPAEGPIEGTDVYGRERQALAAMDCIDGVPHVWLARGVTLEMFAHELVHSYDCVDDGVMNGSPWPDRPTTWGIGQRIVSRYCWDSDVEWAACESVADPRAAVARWKDR